MSSPTHRFAFAATLAFAGLASCSSRTPPSSEAPATVSPASKTTPAPLDEALHACKVRLERISRAEELPGAPGFDENRVDLLGRARGEPMVYVREPAAIPEDELPAALVASRRAFDADRPGARVGKLRARHRMDAAALRSLLLREGYAYASDPLDALALVSQIKLPDLFADEAIALQRGTETRRLRRETRRGETTYRYIDGPLEGRAADLLFGDRVATDEGALATPLHRDLRALAEETGFERAVIERRTEHAMIARLRFGATWARAVLDAKGAELSLGCIAEDASVRDAVETQRKSSAGKRRALAAMRAAVTEAVLDGFRFDRPEGEKTAERDGELRPLWASAYFRGQRSFEHEGTTFPVFGPSGHAFPPTVCVDFVLDTFERASGTWFASLGEKPRRVRGGLDFDETKIPNRRGVIAFAKFAEASPELFEVLRFTGKERIPFRDRAGFFGFLADRAEDVRPGDIVAIQGLKSDGKIHQHAIFVEASDPITGFPYGLADQMKRPRRRTWEGILAEAPLRSLFYRVRPRDAVFDKVDPGEASAKR